SLSFHHAILDGWSVAVMLTEVFQRYLALLHEVVPSLPAPPPNSFPQFVALEREAIDSTEQQHFWSQQLHDAAITKLPRWPRPQPPAELRRVLHYDVPLTTQMSAQLKQLAQTLAVPLKSVLLAAHLRVLNLLT